jgi:hypothetical protein
MQCISTSPIARQTIHETDQAPGRTTTDYEDPSCGILVCLRALADTNEIGQDREMTNLAQRVTNGMTLAAGLPSIFAQQFQPDDACILLI